MNEYKGVYYIPEATYYLYVTSPDKYTTYSTMRRWVRKEYFTPDARLLPPEDLYIDFQELISLRMIVALRLAGFSLRKVRQAYAWLVEKTGYRYPFALKDLWIGRAEIFVEMEGMLSVTKQGQYSFEFIKQWLQRLKRPDCGIKYEKDLNFQNIEGKEVASKWTPYPCVVLDPLIQFGSPCIEETRIPTKSVWAMYVGGDSPRSIARNYEVPLNKIELAIEWEKKLAGAKT